MKQSKQVRTGMVEQYVDIIVAVVVMNVFVVIIMIVSIEFFHQITKPTFLFADILWFGVFL